MNGIENRIVNVVRDGQVELSDSISQFNSDIIFTTIHKIIAPQVLGLHGERMLNLHYSKLPRYSGVIGMQGVASAIRNQDKVIGVTTHRVTSKLDAGPITVQSYFENTNDFKSAVNASFRIGCLQIWESLRELEGDRECLTDKTENLIGNLTVHHSRPISTLPNLVNESFWLSLSDL
jgi:phosphoribosylglycinamide formyltransferase-1